MARKVPQITAFSDIFGPEAGTDPRFYCVSILDSGHRPDYNGSHQPAGSSYPVGSSLVGRRFLARDRDGLRLPEETACIVLSPTFFVTGK